MSKSTTPTVSIIIPAYNEASAIRRCLLAAINQSSPAEEIVVVNNLSTDETAEIVRDIQQEFPTAGIRLLEQSAEQGITPTRNYGFDRATGDVLGRIDADSIIEPGWVEAVRRTFTDPDVAASTGPVLYHDMPMQKFGFAADEKIRSTLHRLARNHRFLFGSNMAIRASAWQKIAALTSHDPEDLMHEDIDLALVLYKNDLEIVYDPTMMAGMSARRLEDSPRDFYNYVMRFERTFKAHGVKSATARIPIFIYLLIYFPVRTVRKFYDGETNQFTLKKLRDELIRDKQTISSDK